MEISDVLKTFLKYFFCWYEYKMGKNDFLKFNDVEIEKAEIHSSIRSSSIDDVNVDSVVVSEEFPCGIKAS